MQECNEPKCSHSRIHRRWSLQGGHYGSHKHLFQRWGFRRLNSLLQFFQGNGRLVTTRVHFRQICKLRRKTSEQILDSIKLCAEIHHVPSGKLPRIASKFAFSLHWGQTDGLVLCPPNSTEGIPHFGSTVSCHRRHRCQPVPRLCLRALSTLCTQTDISIKVHIFITDWKNWVRLKVLNRDGLFCTWPKWEEPFDMKIVIYKWKDSL